MTDDTRDNDGESGSGGKPPPDEAALSARLGSLHQRLSQIQDDRKVQTDQSETGSGNAQSRASAMAVGFRPPAEPGAGGGVGEVLGGGVERPGNGRRGLKHSVKRQ